MTNIINLESVGWKSKEYGESYLEGDTHQHLVKVADYVVRKDSDSKTAVASSELQYIGAYEYAPGGWISEHTHSRAEQWYFIQSGRGIMRVGDEEKEAGPGTIVFVPHDTIHSYEVVGDEPLRILNIATWWPGEDSVTSSAEKLYGVTPSKTVITVLCPNVSPQNDHGKYVHDRSDY